jgi:lia operon protein LiaG
MKIKVVVVVFFIVNVMSVYCGGLKEENLVNEREIGLEHIDTIEIAYRWEEINLFRSNTDSLVIKEYMSRDNSNYYAAINTSNGRLIIERGKRPLGILFNTFNVRVEVYLPASYRNAITVKATSGRIKADGELVCSDITIENSSGSISVNTITAEAAHFKTSSGSIAIKNITGDVTAEASSGRIELNLAGGGLIAKTSSGSIRCTVSESAGDISLTASSGSVTLNLPETLAFNFSSRTSSGSLSTPFSDKLFSPVSDRHSAQGLVGGSASGTIPAIHIKTTSGSIRVKWID